MDAQRRPRAGYGGIGPPEDALERLRVAPNVDHARSAIMLTRLIDRRNS